MTLQQESPVEDHDAPILSVNVSDGGDPAVIAVAGEVDAYSLPLLDDAVVRTFTTHAQILLDMDDVHFIDSSGLGLLIKSYRRAEDLGGTIQIRGASPAVRRLLEITGQTKRFLLGSADGVAAG